jgi:hypothetical protein
LNRPTKKVAFGEEDTVKRKLPPTSKEKAGGRGRIPGSVIVYRDLKRSRIGNIQCAPISPVQKLAPDERYGCKARVICTIDFCVIP